MLKWKKTKIASILGAALLATAAVNAAAADLKPVRVLIPVRIIDESFSPFTVAKYLGYFKKEGLDVTFNAVGGSNEAAIQISAGNGDIGAASPAEALVGMQSSKNLQIQYVYDLYYSNIWSLTVPPGSPIKSVADLKGKKIGVASMGSAGITFGKAFVTSAGLDPAKDITFIPIGVGAQAITAVKTGAVDALAFWDAALAKFEVAGLELRALPVDKSLVTLPDVSLLARPDTIKRDPKMIEGFARAVAKGYDFTMANPAAAVAITWKMYPEARPKNIPADKAIGAGIKVNQRRMAIWSSPESKVMHGKFDAAGWENLVGFLMKQGILTEKLPTSRIFTNSFIKAANDYDRKAVIEQAKAFDAQDLK